MSKEEKEHLVNVMADLSLKDILDREDMVEMLEICRDACNRRIETLEKETKTEGAVQ